MLKCSSEYIAKHAAQKYEKQAFSVYTTLDFEFLYRQIPKLLNEKINLTFLVIKEFSSVYSSVKFGLSNRCCPTVESCIFGHPVLWLCVGCSLSISAAVLICVIPDFRTRSICSPMKANLVSVYQCSRLIVML